MIYDKERHQSPLVKAKLTQLRKSAEALQHARKFAREIAERQVAEAIASAQLERDNLVRDLWKLAQIDENKKGLSAAEIKRAMLNSNHENFKTIIGVIDVEGYKPVTPWYEEEPYLSNPWTFSKPQEANGFYLYKITHLYLWTGEIEMWLGVSGGEWRTVSKHKMWQDRGPDPFEEALEIALPGVPEEARAEILDRLTEAVSEARR